MVQRAPSQARRGRNRREDLDGGTRSGDILLKVNEDWTKRLSLGRALDGPEKAITLELNAENLG